MIAFQLNKEVFVMRIQRSDVSRGYRGNDRLWCTFNFGGYVCVISWYKSATDITLTWSCGTESETSWYYIQNNKVTYPLLPTIAGFGINDLKRQSFKGHLVYHQKWVSMIKRAYCPIFKSINSAYDEATVCDEWRLYSNFLEWSLKWDNVGELELDKDFIGCGSNIYSPETCMYIPKYLNTLLVSCMKPPTFTWKERLSKYEVVVSKRTLGLGTTGAYEGVYSTLEGATKAYWTAKQKLIKDVLNIRYKKDPLFNQEVYDKIMNSKWITQENPLEPIQEK